MKVVFSIFILLACSFSVLHAQLAKRVLFLGNSYTAVNNLPLIAQKLAESAGDTLVVDSNTPGGYTFQGHSTNATSVQKIQQGNWDFVVLQEQSQLPSFPISQVQSDVFPYAKTLDGMIKAANPCTQTMFYMTWGRKVGDATNCPNWPPVCTYQGMDSLLHLRYMMMADTNRALVSPVGAVWRYLIQHYPWLELYQADGSHPSVAGSYAAACSFYSAIFRKSPNLITEHYGLPDSVALYIKDAADKVVFDSLSHWHIGRYDPMAAFYFTLTNDSSVQFYNISEYADTYYWDFGDGDTTSQFSPLHTYSQSGTYTVTLFVNRCGMADTFESEIVINLVSGLEEEAIETVVVYPNPSGNMLYLQADKALEARFIDAQARTWKVPTTWANGQLSLDVSGLPAGIYGLLLGDNPKPIKVLKD